MRISPRFAPDRFSVRRGPDCTVGGICPVASGLSVGLCGCAFRNQRPALGSGGMQTPRNTSSLRLFFGYASIVGGRGPGARSPEYRESIPAQNVERFFQDNLGAFKPDAVYRAKTWGRFRPEYQLSFVDLGLLPLVEEQVGKSLGKLVERNVAELKSSIGWGDVTDEQGHWLLQTVFWLVSGKILRDKRVERFADLNLNDVEEVFRRLGRHYGTEPLAIDSRKKLEGLRESARIIDQFASLALTTTESLAYVYENTLISKQTRSAFGTHRTPSYLVDYVVGNLIDWIEEISVNERSVFEPACGHSAFLVSAMRLLTEMLPAEKAVPSRQHFC